MTIDDVKNNLKAHNYIATAEDDWLINFAMEKVTERIKSFTNQPIVPEGLNSVAIDMATGEVLRAKKQSGGLTGTTFDSVVKSVQEGDTTVQYAVDASPEKHFDVMVNNMINGHASEMIAYRRLRW